ncbi:MAG: acetyl-CoA carboxylase biotin carboxylase subunit [Candidatus Dormibacteraeota bacterium]|nr:acetyl-CoA carboxylase biotin carboxylase subunit [Candidatus Dormibacteraeota bacterium]MBV9525114.1 acetyl-CoA carboxylase biotin carboxylase subunit [Candidatus Dormibacteraeota bacterium]
MFDKVLVANRGEIAVRVIRACRDLGVSTVAVHSEADRNAAFVTLADEAVEIGPAPSAQSYLVIDRIIDAARSTGAQAVHPGYGFLSENQAFARACADVGIAFVGPPADAMAVMGGKVPARARMVSSGVPVVPGSDALSSVEDAVTAAAEVGYPVLIKASAGGGGIGMRVARDERELREGVETARSTAARAFGDDTVFLERYVEEPRHIEIQVIADGHGNVVHLGERECSVQRRHQKIIEESPSPVIDPEQRARMGEAAVTAARAVGYVNAGTVEFIYSRGEFFFLEMNTRLQVEHPITELVYGVDLVVEQLRVAAGATLSFTQDGLQPRGHAIECRVNAENYAKGFLPSPGQVTGYHEPAGPGVRVDSSLAGPGLVSPNYDPMIAKLIVHGPSREMAIDRMRRALFEYVITGIRTNIPYHLAVLSNERFRAGEYTTHFIEEHPELVGEADAWAERQQALQRLVRDPARAAAIAAAVAVTS